DVYPDLLHPSVNRFPAWLPLLAPQPGWVKRRPARRDAWLQLLRLLGVALVVAGAVVARLEGGSVGALAALVGAGLFVAGVLLGVGGRLLSVRELRRAGWRKRLAALIATLERSPPGALGLMLEDDAACAAALQRFLAAHQVPYDVPLYD